MKCAKTIFKDILFYAPIWSDDQGTSYSPFNGKIEDNDAEKDTIIDDDEKFQLISVSSV